VAVENTDISHAGITNAFLIGSFGSFNSGEKGQHGDGRERKPHYYYGLNTTDQAKEEKNSLESKNSAKSSAWHSYNFVL